jgi:hypothetical protein
MSKKTKLILQNLILILLQLGVTASGGRPALENPTLWTDVAVPSQGEKLKKFS